MNKKRLHRLWVGEGLQRRRPARRKRAGQSTVPIASADRPNTVWAIDFQFDVTTGGRAIKIASMVDEYTRQSLLHIVDRSITADQVITQLQAMFAAHGRPQVLRCDNGPEFISTALQRFCRQSDVAVSYIPPGTPWNNGYIESFNNRLRTECLNRHYWHSVLHARVVIGDFKDEHNQRHRHCALGYLTPDEYAANQPEPTRAGTPETTSQIGWYSKRG